MIANAEREHLRPIMAVDSAEVPASGSWTDDLKYCPPQLKEGLKSLPQLGGYHSQLFEMVANPEMLDQAIAYQTDALKQAPHDELRLQALSDLSDYCLKKYKLRDDFPSLRTAIEHRREAVQIAGVYSPQRPQLLKDLAFLLYTLGCDKRDEAALNEAIMLEREIVEECTDESKKLEAIANLSISLHMSGRSFENYDNLREAITLRCQELEQLPPGHDQRLHVLRTLGSWCHLLFNNMFDLEVLNAGIEHQRELVGLYPSGHPDRPEGLRVLAVFLFNRFNVTSDRETMDEVVAYEMEYALLLEHGSPKHLEALKSLGQSFRKCYEVFDEIDSLHCAISCSREHLEFCPPGHKRRRDALRTLGESLVTLGNKVGDPQPLQEGTSLQKEAQQLCSEGGISVDQSQGSITISFNGFGEESGGSQSSNPCLDFARQALASILPQLGECGGMLASMMAASSAQCTMTGDIDFSDGGFTMPSARLEECPEEASDQGDALMGHHLSGSQIEGSTSDVSSSTTAMDTQDDFLAPNTPSDIVALRNAAISLEKMAEDLSYPPRERLRQLTQRVSGMLKEVATISDSEAAASILQSLHTSARAATQLLPLVTYTNPDPQAHLVSLADSEEIGVLAAITAVVQAPGEAVELLEESRSVFWNRALQLRNPLEQLKSEEAQEFARLFQVLANGLQSVQSQDSEASEPDVQEMQQANTKAYELISSVRQRPGFERFLMGQSMKSLCSAASKGPAVILIAHHLVCGAITLHRDGSHHALKWVPLPNISYADLENLAKGLKQTNLRFRTDTTTNAKEQSGDPDQLRNTEAGQGQEGHEKDAQVKLDDILRKVWKRVVQPIIKALGIQKQEVNARKRLHWCPTGLFAFLPLHAAQASDRSGDACSDYFISSYTPTLTALINARRQGDTKPFTKRGALLVASQAPGLPNAAEEAANVARILANIPTAILGNGGQGADGATVASVVECLPQASILHLACRSEHSADGPLESGFSLRDGKLTVAQLMRLNLQNAIFAFFGACEAAKGDGKQPEQAVHLGAAMLFAGFRSVITTIWSMNDEDGLVVAKIVYAELMKHERWNPDVIPAALDQAVRELRKSGVPSHRWARYIHLGA